MKYIDILIGARLDIFPRKSDNNKLWCNKKAHYEKKRKEKKKESLPE